MDKLDKYRRGIVPPERRPATGGHGFAVVTPVVPRLTKLVPCQVGPFGDWHYAKFVTSGT